MIDLRAKKILLTGGHGFLGSFVLEKLKQRRIPEKNITLTNSKQHDLRIKEVCEKVVRNHQIVIHCAGKIGGIKYTLEHPAESFYHNSVMALNIIEASRKANVEKLAFVGTACSYPKEVGIPYREDELWTGYPDEINATYGLSKRFALVQQQAYKKEYGLNSVHLLLANLYGPKDDFTLNYSHVIAALIKKSIKAADSSEKELVVWGTGNASREFLYVEDAAEAIILATEKYEKIEPVNIGNGQEISIRELVGLITELTGFKGKITWDTSKPDGQPRRCLDVSRAKNEFGFVAKVSIKEGLQKTIEWYKKNKLGKI